MDKHYEAARLAAQRWLKRSQTPEYKEEKRQKLHLRWQIGVMRRKARQCKDYEALALLNLLEAEMLSQIKRVESALR